jgi:hypothetical protein
MISIIVESAGMELSTTAAAVEELFEALESGGEVATVAVLLIEVPAAVAGATTTFNVKVATPEIIDGIEQLTVPFAPGAGVRQLQPAGAMSDAKASGAGRTSLIVTPEASLGPKLVTTIVYCSGPPANTGPETRVLLIPTSKRTADCTLALAELFAGTESLLDDTVAVMPIDVPDGVDDTTREMTVNVADAAGFIEPDSVQLTVPFAPTAGAVQLHPNGAETETNVVAMGSGNWTVALTAALGPLFVAVIVHVMFDPAFTGFGAAVSIALKSVEG